jgi:DMSO/TMAO reductase YedYZ molybdopterin-dependent catalytic subunit
MAFVNRGFQGRRDRRVSGIPPGQHLVEDFPVLSAGPTPDVPLDTWDFRLVGDDDAVLARWTWDELQALPHDTPTVDIHCVTTWSKLGTRWEGVSIDVLLDAAGVDPAAAGYAYALAFCDGGYTTNVPVADLTGGRAWVAWGFDGRPLEPEHGGPARLLVPHLYFWKSAKWVRGLRLLARDEPGFWERLGYHDRGDPWREQRYQGD